MNIWHDMSPRRINPDDFIAFVEIPKGCKSKYELECEKCQNKRLQEWEQRNYERKLEESG